MRAVGGEAEHHVAGPDAAAVDDFAFFHHAHGEAGQIVFAFGIHAGHFGRFAANQGAAGLFAALGDAFNHIGGARHIELAAGEIVEEKQRLCALHEDVVHAHGHQVDAHGVVNIPFKRQFQLGAYAVGAAYQHGVLILFADFHQRAEAAQAAQHFGAHGALGKGFDVFDQLVARIDIDTGIAVAEGLGHGILSGKNLKQENAILPDFKQQLRIELGGLIQQVVERTLNGGEGKLKPLLQQGFWRNKLAV